MHTLLKTGRLFYGLAIIAYGVQQIVIQDFRPQIIPPFPSWAHQYSIFAIASGVAMIVLGVITTGFVKVASCNPATACLYLGIYFLLLIITCHFPYLLFIFPHKLSHLGVWADLLKELAFSGGSFVMTASLLNDQPPTSKNKHSTKDHLFLAGRLFFCTTMVLFGWSHFVYNSFISQLVPAWLGMSRFWAYFGGVALISAGLAIALKTFLRQVALLLAIMLFLWFVLVHVPGAIANPAAGRGNAIVSAFDAILFCGTALAISRYRNITLTEPEKMNWRRNAERNTVSV